MMRLNSPPALRIYLLGGFRVEQGARWLGESDWPRRKAKSLFKILALRRGHRLPRDQVLDLFWPALDLKAASNNLYRAIHQIRRLLEPELAEAAASSYLTLEGDVVALRPTGVAWVDVEEFERLARSGQERGDLAALEQAASLYAGDLLPEDLYEDWTAREREELRSTYFAVLLRLASVYERRGEPERAIDALRRLLARDVCHEEAHRGLMRLYAQTGQRHLAIRQFQLCQEALRCELDVEVHPDTTGLLERIVAGEAVAQPAPSTLTCQVPAQPPSQLVEAKTRTPEGAARVPVDLRSVVARAGPTTLVGRARELAQLEDLLRQAFTGERRLVLLTGEAGVGKSALAQAILTRAADLGARTLAGACYELEGLLPYGPFVDALRAYLRCQSEGDIARLAAEAGNVLDRLLPEVSVPGVATGVTPLAESPQDRSRLFEAFTRLFRALATTTPVAVLLEDIQAADEGTLQLLHYLVRSTESLPLFLLVTFREEAGRERLLRRLAGELYREKLGTRFGLHRLAAEASAGLIETNLGGQISAELAAAIYRIAEGNPFYTLELVRHLQETERLRKASGDPDGRWQILPGSAIAVPPELRDIVVQRLEHLGDDAFELLGLAAVIGRDFDYSVLRAASGLLEERLFDVLDRALAARLIVETGTGYRFGHALTREALYGGLNRWRRARLHGAVAAAFERLPAAQHDERIEVLAHHYDRAEQVEPAIVYAILAGDRAAEVYANEVAVGYYRQALARLETLNVPGRRLAEVLEKLGDVHRLAGEVDAGLAAYQRAIAAVGEALPLIRLRLHRKSAQAALLSGRLDTAADHFTQACALVEGAGDDIELARVHQVAAQLSWHRENGREAFAAAQRSLRIAERLSSPTDMAQAYSLLAVACHSLGEWQQGIDYELKRQGIHGPILDATESFDAYY